MFHFFSLKRKSASCVVNHTQLGRELVKFIIARQPDAINKSATANIDLLCTLYLLEHSQASAVISRQLIAAALVRLERIATLSKIFYPHLNSIIEDDFAYDTNGDIDIDKTLKKEAKRLLDTKGFYETPQAKMLFKLSVEKGWSDLCAQFIAFYKQQSALTIDLELLTSAVSHFQLATSELLWNELLPEQRETFLQTRAADLSDSCFLHNKPETLRFLLASLGPVRIYSHMTLRAYHPFILAATQGYTSCLQVLWEQADEDMKTTMHQFILSQAIHAAISNGRVNAFQWLLQLLQPVDQKAYLRDNAVPMLQIALRHNFMEMAEYLWGLITSEQRAGIDVKGIFDSHLMLNWPKALAFLAGRYAKEELSPHLAKPFQEAIELNSIVTATDLWAHMKRKDKQNFMATEGRCAIVGAIILHAKDALEFLWSRASLKLRNEVLFHEQGAPFCFAVMEEKKYASRLLWGACDTEQRQRLLTRCKDFDISDETLSGTLGVEIEELQALRCVNQPSLLVKCQ